MDQEPHGGAKIWILFFTTRKKKKKKKMNTRLLENKIQIFK